MTKAPKPKRAYAEGTTTPVFETRNTIERELKRFGATGFAYATKGNVAHIGFTARDRNIRFTLTLPDPQAEEFRVVKAGWSVRERSEVGREDAWEKACRRLWRSLLLSVKAKLVAVEDGVEAFDEAFYAHVVLNDGSTVYEATRERVAAIYRGESVPLLPPPAKDRGA